MSNGSSDQSRITVAQLQAAITRAEHWLRTVKDALAALPDDTEITLPEDSESLKVLRELQPKTIDIC